MTIILLTIYQIYYWNLYYWQLYCLIVLLGNSTGTTKRELDALEADFGSVVFCSAARTVWNERKKDAQVREENGKAVPMKILCRCAIRKFHLMIIDLIREWVINSRNTGKRKNVKTSFYLSKASKLRGRFGI